MNNITLTFDKGQIDIPSQEISITYNNWRFTEGLREAFSTDFSVPKTAHNINVLNAVGLLDSLVQPLGAEYNAVLSLGSDMLTVKVQFISISEDTIDLCLFERTFSEGIDSVITIRDTQDSIFPWCVNTDTTYPDWFVKYDNGSLSTTDTIVGLHPSRSLNSVLQEARYSIQTLDPTWRLIATDKYVCPENTVQMLEASYGGNNILNLAVGQHITNDGPGFISDTDDSVQRITFNRECIVRGRALIYVQRSNVSAPRPYTVSVKLAGMTLASITADMTGSLISRVYEMNFFTIANDTLDLYFEIDETARLEKCNICCKLDITDYNISDDDYKKDELTYTGRTPRLIVQQAGQEVYWNFDGSTYTYGGTTFTTPFSAWSYFGYYCNIPNEKISDLVSSLQWILGKRATETDGQIVFVQDSVKEIDAEITKISTSSEHLGQNNYILYKDETPSAQISEISNDWLEESLTLKELQLTKVTNKNNLGRIPQYEVHYEDGEYKVDFNEFECFTIMSLNLFPERHLIPIQNFSRCGFDHITQSVEIEASTFDDVAYSDYIYVRGRKIMVISTDKDIERGETTITGLLVPTL